MGTGKKMAPPGITGDSAGEIASSVRALIDGGVLHASDPLPSIRTLATELGVNRNTVAAAYAQLAASGMVHTRRRGGTLVSGLPKLDGEGRPAPANLVNLSSGNPDPLFLPKLGGLLETDYRPLLYGAPPVSDELREWSASHMEPDVQQAARLVLTHGSVDAVERLFEVFLTRGDIVAVEDPCFLSSIGALLLGGYRSALVPVDEEGMTVDGLRSALAAGARAIVCTPRAHNPTGASLSPQRARELSELLADYPRVLIIEDDHFSAVSSRPFLRITPESAPRWALVRTVSKFLGPDLRLAFVLADPDTALRLESRLNSATTWISHVLQHIVARLLSGSSTQVLLNRARSAYAERSQLLLQALLQQGFEMPAEIDGLNVWIPLHSREGPIVEELAKRGWAVRSGADFALGDRPTPAIRVTTATMTREQADAFAADLADLA